MIALLLQWLLGYVYIFQGPQSYYIFIAKSDSEAWNLLKETSGWLSEQNTIMEKASIESGLIWGMVE